jgi:hypothetical protein
MLEARGPTSLRIGWWRSDGTPIEKPARKKKMRRWSKAARSKAPTDAEDETLAAGTYFGIDFANITSHGDREADVAEKERRAKAEVSASTRLLVPDHEPARQGSEREQ